jgi:hypothetical protein
VHSSLILHHQSLFGLDSNAKIARDGFGMGGIKPVRLIFTHYSQQMKGGSIPRLLEICRLPFTSCVAMSIYSISVLNLFYYFYSKTKEKIPAAARITVYLLIGLFGDSPVFLYYVTPLVGLTLSLGKYTPCDDRKKKALENLTAVRNAHLSRWKEKRLYLTNWIK